MCLIIGLINIDYLIKVSNRLRGTSHARAIGNRLIRPLAAATNLLTVHFLRA